MGCGWSHSSVAQRSPGSGSTQSKAPILMFCLPGNARSNLTKIVTASSNETDLTSIDKKLGVRFIDVPNHRSYRKHWPRELANKTDRAMVIYLADIRDEPSFLLNVKTLNWFVKASGSQSIITIVLICDDEKQMHEFIDTASFKEVEIIPIYEKKPESVERFSKTVQTNAQRFLENKNKNGPTSPKTPN